MKSSIKYKDGVKDMLSNLKWNSRKQNLLKMSVIIFWIFSK